MKYAIVFGAMGLAEIAVAVVRQGYNWLWLWVGLSFLIVAAGYAGLGVAVFGKRVDGRIALISLLMLLPYLLFTWSIWHLRRLLVPEPVASQIIPWLWLGRRPLHGELPDGIHRVVDFTCEFCEPVDVRAGRRYICCPTLDGGVPEAQAFIDLLADVAQSTENTYVHCAQGNGRSAMFVAALLLSLGEARNVNEAVDLLRKIRPSIRLNRRQLTFLAKVMVHQPNDMPTNL